MEAKLSGMIEFYHALGVIIECKGKKIVVRKQFNLSCLLFYLVMYNIMY